MQGFPGMFMKVTIYSTEQGFRQIYLHMNISGFGIEITKSTLCNGMYYIWLSMEELKHPGPRLNIKTVLSTYGDFHVKDKTAVRTSYL